MMVEIKRLLEYNREIRHRYFDTLARLPWEELTKNREASWHSLRNIFIHTLGATEHWLDVLENKQKTKHRGFDEYTNIEDIRGYMQGVEDRMQKYLDGLSQSGLEKKFNVRDDEGKDVGPTAEDILIHVFEEEVHHRGELIGLLWQMGIEPPLMGWMSL